MSDAAAPERKRNPHNSACRTNLIMHFHCAECGSRLNIAYPKDAAEPVSPGYDIGGESEPTGAACRYVPVISVEPCRACIDKYTGPAVALTQAIKALGSIG